MDARDVEAFERLATEIAKLHSQPTPTEVLPSGVALAHGQEKLVMLHPTYGFVTGGTTPAAALADHLVTYHDQNVQVHLPFETVATNVEDTTLNLVCNLLDLDPQHWPHRTFTTGATTSNVLGLACGREYVIAEASAHRTDEVVSVGEVGIIEAMRRAGIDEIQILTTVPHSSLSKAASILGLGRASVKTIGLTHAPHKFNMDTLKILLAQPGSASIVAVSASEVNTGLFATISLEEMQELRRLCDMYGAWIHVDGAFGLFARVLSHPSTHTLTTNTSNTTYDKLINAASGIPLADSLTGDLHKLLNVPYDSGFFLSRHANLAARVFQNPNAAYLATGAVTGGIMSPLNIGLENSRRFRALPAYATLVAYGRDGYKDMLERQIALARGIAKFVLDSSAFELLPQATWGTENQEDILSRIFIIVLFRARDEELNRHLVERIKAKKKIYVSGTTWDGSPACRFAVANWMADVRRDLRVIKEVLEGVVAAWMREKSTA
ncbi:hypothetical protein LEMA_P098910.1 [Plenodomus lingam JN3]|uniref:Pyridoxal-dependent decarboxylase n=1 Tax=Leptosphaeria maculans (strain JN3 / isolate v23.1.3 / race Av1-4-5-6-7-8) TaxID=985895 RepID=E5A4D7_LEPMJ|nr:hypothetical protein LEMA_P098910.1 [Plenodomus lingam JN3]CBX98482.1 hypothetical protein LEMA_P098910.1 [Plenodomus lingam JN3]